jgi:minor extracellular protease Epr
MIHKIWGLVIASVLVFIILHEGQVFATDARGRKKIVMVSNNTDLQLLQLVLRGSRITVVHTLSFINALAIVLPLDGTVEEELTYLQNLLDRARVLGLSGVDIYDDLVVSVLPISPALPGEVPLLTDLYDWGLERIGADVAHREMPTWTGEGVQVAVVDTGVDCGHPDLPPIVDGFNALPGGVLYCDDHGHGTHIAGIIAARRNSRGIVGVAPKASIVAVKVLDADGSGYLSNLINGLQWIYNNQIQKRIWLVNMSLGFSGDSRPLKRAIQKLVDQDTIMVASAGNSCSDDPGQDEAGGEEGDGPACDSLQTTTVKYPAAYSEVLAVTATDANDRIASYSLTGPEIAVTAPGGVWKAKRILSTYLGGWYSFGSGTSQAAAHVTGTLALKLQQQRILALDDVQWLLQHTATVLVGYPRTQQGWGLIAAESLLAHPNR